MECNGNVYLLDDDRRVLNSVENLLGSVGYAVKPFFDPLRFVASVECDAPGCLILDVNLGSKSGFEVLTETNAKEAALSTIFISGQGDIPTVLRAMKSGACDFLTKPLDGEMLLTAVGTALTQSREKWQNQQSLGGIRQNYEKLTPREREVLPFVIRGYLNKQTAYELKRSEITIRIHRGNIMRKMDAKSLAHLVKLAGKLGIE
jgi:FixJ family two-component response regulator